MLFKRLFSGDYRKFIIFISFLSFLFVSCSSEKEPDKTEVETAKTKYSRFVSYDSFRDKPDLHMAVAARKGVGPLQSRNDTLKFAGKMQKLPDELDIYKLDKLTHSVPFLIDDAAKLLMQISFNFRDSLRRKDIPPYKLIVTSVTRTTEDVKNLSKRNINAIENSVHCYGTTFDISWKRFEKIGPKGEDDVTAERLKYVLGQVLHDLRQRDRCYVVHEKKQACFHITVR